MATQKKSATPRKKPAEPKAEVSVAKASPPVATVEEAPLRIDGPTLAEFVAAGYSAEDYPPAGYAVRTDEAAPFERPAEPATVTNVPVGRFPVEDTPEPGSGFAPAPGRFPAE